MTYSKEGYKLLDIKGITEIPLSNGVRQKILIFKYNTYNIDNINLKRKTISYFVRILKDHISAYAQPTHLTCGTVKYTDNIFHTTKNIVCGCCVGVDMANQVLEKNSGNFDVLFYDRSKNLGHKKGT